MRGLWERLFGIDLSGWDQKSDWSVEWASLSEDGGVRLGLTVLGFLALAGIWFLYRRDARALSAGPRRLLTAVRCLVLAGVVFMILEPLLVLERRDERPSNLLILEDVSASMGVRDAVTDEGTAAQLALALGQEPGQLLRATRGSVARPIIDRLVPVLEQNGDRRVHRHAFADRLVMTTTSDEAQPNPTFTAVGSALEQALAAYRGPPLAGVLLVTDGRSNTGPNPLRAAELARRGQFPIASLMIGSDAGARNARIIGIEVPPITFVSDPFEVHVDVQGTGILQEERDLVIERRIDGGDWETLATRPVAFPDEGRLVRVTVSDRHDKPCSLEFRATLDAFEDETHLEDNQARAESRVIGRKIRTLVIASQAFPEVQFLINTLMRDEGIDCSSWLMFSDQDYVQKGNTVLTRLPLTDAELEGYDCVVLYDPDLRELPAGFTALLHKFVGEKGGGLVFMAGESNSAAIFDRTVPGADDLLPMLPVIREPGLYVSPLEQKLFASRPWNLELTPSGLRDGLFRFDENAQKNHTILSTLPGMFWHFQVTREKPGALVLARHGDPRMANRHGRHVVAALQFFGPGPCLFLSMDSTYRWRFLGEPLFDGFWARVIDRVGRGKMLGGRHPILLSSDRPEYEPGDLVTVSARFRDSDNSPDLDYLAAEVEGQGEDAQDLILGRSPEDPGAWVATFRVSRGGQAQVRVWPAPSRQPGVRPATLPVNVTFPDRELAQPAIDRPALEAVAELTESRVFTLDDWDRIPDAFRIGRVSIPERNRQELWDAPLVWASLLGLLFLEWVLRKRWRMV